MHSQPFELSLHSYFSSFAPVLGTSASYLAVCTARSGAAHSSWSPFLSRRPRRNRARGNSRERNASIRGKPDCIVGPQADVVEAGGFAEGIVTAAAGPKDAPTLLLL